MAKVRVVLDPWSGDISMTTALLADYWVSAGNILSSWCSGPFLKLSEPAFFGLVHCLVQIERLEQKTRCHVEKACFSTGQMGSKPKAGDRNRPDLGLVAFKSRDTAVITSDANENPILDNSLWLYIITRKDKNSYGDYRQTCRCLKHA